MNSGADIAARPRQRAAGPDGGRTRAGAACRRVVAVLSWVPLTLAGCDSGPDQYLLPELSPPSLTFVEASQQPGCLEEAIGDSCFDYRFTDTLSILFCVGGNCCPDRGRFRFTHRLGGDTISITVADTAASECECTCTYRLVMAFTDLNRESYYVRCYRQGEASARRLYAVQVHRRRPLPRDAQVHR